MPTTTIDFSALTDPLTDSEVQAFRTKIRPTGVTWDHLHPGQQVGGLVVFPFVLVFLFIAASLLPRIATNQVTVQGAVETIAPMIFSIAVVVVLVVGIFAGIAAWHRRWELWTRMDKFAVANGMTFSPSDADPSYVGAIFQQGDARKSIDHLRSTTGRFFDLGNYRYTTGSGKSRTTHTWGFLAFNLDRKLPNMVLDSKANNSLFGTNLPASFDKGQILSLEGDFDRWFTLYCPKEYERDALYVFTPDLMALLIDEAAPFDVEIIDDWMFVYSSVPFRTGDPGMYARLFRIIDTVGAKTLSQTDRYVDERVGDFAANVVAPQGARLKRRVSVGAIILGVVFIGFWLWGILGDALQGFGT